MATIGPGADPSAVLCGSDILNGVTAAVHSDVSIYSIDPRGLQSPGFISPSIDGRGGPGAALQKAQAAEGFN